MLYIICPTCGRCLADKMIPYREGLKKICSDVSLSDEQKYDEKIKLVDSLQIPRDRYCCRARLITYRELINIVK